MENGIHAGNMQGYQYLLGNNFPLLYKQVERTCMNPKNLDTPERKSIAHREITKVSQLGEALDIVNIESEQTRNEMEFGVESVSKSGQTTPGLKQIPTKYKRAATHV